LGPQAHPHKFACRIWYNHPEAQVLAVRQVDIHPDLVIFVILAGTLRFITVDAKSGEVDIKTDCFLERVLIYFN